MTKDGKEKLFKKPYALDLLKIAEGDLLSARVLLESDKGRPENACYLAQQSAHLASDLVSGHR